MFLMSSDSKEDVSEYIETHRNRTAQKDVYISFEDNIHFYTGINIAMLDICAKEIAAADMDRLLVAFDAILRAGDAVGIQRAMGSR